jgi:hypothetical protein
MLGYFPVLNLFLTNQEIIELTGFRQRTRQVAMLRAQGVPFHMNAAGCPKVARAFIEGRTLKTAHQSQKGWVPSWGADQA